MEHSDAMSDSFKALGAAAKVQSHQFNLKDLFEFLTICAILSAASPLIGIAPSLVLIVMTAALWTRQGWLVLALLAAGLLVADMPSSADASGGTASYGSQVVMILIASGLVFWCRLRCTGTTGGNCSLNRTRPVV